MFVKDICSTSPIGGTELSGTCVGLGSLRSRDDLESRRHGLPKYMWHSATFGACCLH